MKILQNTKYIILIVCFMSSFSFGQVKEIYIMTTNAYPRINESQKSTLNNNDSSISFATYKATTITLLAAIDYELKNNYWLRANYYYQNKYYDRYISSNSSSNYTTSNNALRDRKIHTTYIDILRKQNFEYVQFYYGLFIGGYYETPYNETTTLTNYKNSTQSAKRIILYNTSGIYATQLGLVIGFYFKVYKSISIGMEIRDFLAYEIANKIETTTTTNYGANNIYIDKTEFKSETKSRVL